jgi:hypothetical protein
VQRDERSEILACLVPRGARGARGARGDGHGCEVRCGVEWPKGLEVGRARRLLREEGAEVDPRATVLDIALHDAHGEPLPLAGGEEVVLQNLAASGVSTVRHEFGKKKVRWTVDILASAPCGQRDADCVLCRERVPLGL